MYNIGYIHVINMQDIIIMAKILDGSDKKIQPVVNMPDTKIMYVYNITNIFLKYNWHSNTINNEIAVDLRLQNIKKT